MNGPGQATALAIFGGFALVAVVLWRGLEHIARVLELRQSAPPVTAAESQSASATAPLALVTRPSASAQETREQQEIRRNEQAQYAFIRQAPDYVRACWKPQPAPPGQQPDFGGAFELDVTFDATGTEVRRAVHTGGYAKPALVECVKATQLAPLKIPAPGEPFTVRVHMPIP